MAIMSRRVNNQQGRTINLNHATGLSFKGEVSPALSSAAKDGADQVEQSSLDFSSAKSIKFGKQQRQNSSSSLCGVGGTYKGGRISDSSGFRTAIAPVGVVSDDATPSTTPTTKSAASSVPRPDAPSPRCRTIPPNREGGGQAEEEAQTTADGGSTANYMQSSSTSNGRSRSSGSGSAAVNFDIELGLPSELEVDQLQADASQPERKAAASALLEEVEERGKSVHVVSLGCGPATELWSLSYFLLAKAHAYSGNAIARAVLVDTAPWKDQITNLRHSFCEKTGIPTENIEMDVRQEDAFACEVFEQQSRGSASTSTQLVVSKNTRTNSSALPRSSQDLQQQPSNSYLLGSKHQPGASGNDGIIATNVQPTAVNMNYVIEQRRGAQISSSIPQENQEVGTMMPEDAGDTPHQHEAGVYVGEGNHDVAGDVSGTVDNAVAAASSPTSSDVLTSLCEHAPFLSPGGGAASTGGGGTKCCSTSLTLLTVAEGDRVSRRVSPRAEHYVHLDGLRSEQGYTSLKVAKMSQAAANEHRAPPSSSHRGEVGGDSEHASSVTQAKGDPPVGATPPELSPDVAKGESPSGGALQQGPEQHAPQSVAEELLQEKTLGLGSLFKRTPATQADGWFDRQRLNLLFINRCCRDVGIPKVRKWFPRLLTHLVRMDLRIEVFAVESPAIGSSVFRLTTALSEYWICTETPLEPVSALSIVSSTTATGATVPAPVADVKTTQSSKRTATSSGLAFLSSSPEQKPRTLYFFKRKPKSRQPLGARNKARGGKKH
ncbi:unnamed protein product [Amoebophrya sp. A25]|nr:unnamed protein product [Amoebophrya sp. A25]|eukprot:GSA25T00005885001.1